MAASETEKIVEKVRDRYAKIAEGQLPGCCGAQASPCGAGEQAVIAQGVGYSKSELDALPEGANLGLGCGAPIGQLGLQPGETVLDLGSGAGIDVLLAARQVGATGRAIGVDMTPEMLEKARANARKAGASNAEFRQGRLESLPLGDQSVDAVTSNCVINLVPDKAAVFREVARVLRPGGRLVISDIVLDGRLPEAVERDVYAYVGCISGAMEREAYLEQLRAAGLSEIEVLKDVDYVAAMADAAPQEVQELLSRTGITREQVIGKVRSLTYRARKPAAASCCAPSCCGG
jgi:SAM-dependent methyltransferase